MTDTDNGTAPVRCGYFQAPTSACLRPPVALFYGGRWEHGVPMCDRHIEAASQRCGSYGVGALSARGRTGLTPHHPRPPSPA